MTIPAVPVRSRATSAWANQVADAINSLKASASIATSQSTSSTTYANLATVGPVFTLVTGTVVRVTLSATIDPAGDLATAAVAVSGATTVSAPAGLPVNTISASGGLAVSRTGSWVISGLTPGTNTFTVKYQATDTNGGGLSVAFANRLLVVERLD